MEINWSKQENLENKLFQAIRSNNLKLVQKIFKKYKNFIDFRLIVMSTKVAIQNDNVEILNLLLESTERTNDWIKNISYSFTTP